MTNTEKNQGDQIHRQEELRDDYGRSNGWDTGRVHGGGGEGARTADADERVACSAADACVDSPLPPFYNCFAPATAASASRASRR